MRSYKKKKLHSSWPPYDTSNPGNIVDIGDVNPLKNGGKVQWQIMEDGGTIPQDNTYVSLQNLTNQSNNPWYKEQYPRVPGRMETFKQVVNPMLQFGFNSASTSGPATYGTANNYQNEFTRNMRNLPKRDYTLKPNRWLNPKDNFGTMTPGKVNKPYSEPSTTSGNSNVSMKYNLSDKTVPKNLVYQVNHNIDVNDAAYVDYGVPMKNLPIDRYFKEQFPDKFRGNPEWYPNKNKKGGLVKWSIC